jgi:hypothetical protein
MKKAIAWLPILGLALLIGCLNPIEFDPEVVEVQGEQTINNEAPVLANDEPLDEPFSIVLEIPEAPGGGGRSIIGPDTPIKSGTATLNYAQVVVLDNNGKVVYFGAQRQRKADDSSATFAISGVENWNVDHRFLVLMGHWEREYTEGAGGDYVYKDGAAPTLLATGYTEVEPSRQIPVEMYPLKVDTSFVGTDGTTEQPVVGAALSVVPVPWTVQWTVQGAGFTNLITAEGKTPNSTAITEVFTASSTGSFNGSAISDALTAGAAGTWTLSKDLSTYTTLENVGKSGYVNFNLTYVPFKDKTWDGVSVTTPSGGASGGKPRWIIRNGINDTPQDTNTSFTLSSGTIPWNGTKNGNGAVNFTVALDVDSSLGVSGQFTGSSEISYTTTGYTGTGDVYYAATSESSAPAWSLSNYKLIGDDEVAGTYSASGSSIDSSKNGYVILVKDGKMSSPAKLTKQVVINPTWP